MKKILGLDLGTTSIGWAFVKEAESEREKSEIVKLGVRIIPLTTDEETDFRKGKAATINANRTLKRGARRNLNRYQLRRDALIETLKNIGFITNETLFSEDGKNTTFSSYSLRAKAVNEKVTREEFVRILLMINKKRGYKSSRKARNEDEGNVIDGMEVAKYLYDNQMSPGQYVYARLKKGKKYIPDFYRSDLQNELDKIWNFQKQFYPNILVDELQDEITGKSKAQTWKILEEPFKIVGIKQKGTVQEKNLEKYYWRNFALKEKIELEQLAIVIQEINNQLNKSSGYLGAIGDRSKELYFEKLTVGQYLYRQVQKNPHTRLKGQVFYRQDYLDEFDIIWKKQKQFYPELTDEIKTKVRDTIIFYQRPLKSQKGLLSFCEFESQEQEYLDETTGKKKVRTIGNRVVPKSSPLFQEFKVWLMINNLELKHISTKTIYKNEQISQELKEELFAELNIKKQLKANEILKILVDNPKEYELNYKDGLDGNQTNAALYKVYQKIIELEGEEYDFKKLKADEINDIIISKFAELNIEQEILLLNSEKENKRFDKQPLMQLWHLLYSFEGDNTRTGDEKLIQALKNKFGFKSEHAKLLVNITFEADYGSLSSKAIRKILPYLREGNRYDLACNCAGYNHSSSLTKEEQKNKVLKHKLELLPKNSLRNPVVEKILNQLVNVVNAIIEDDNLGKPDEIRIELARELKKSAKEREFMTKEINKSTLKHENIRKKLKEIYPFNTGVRITRNDIIKYKLYEELAPIGYRTIYTNEYVKLEELFSNKFDVEHIIPKAVLFDDSFSNKTLATRDFNNREKGNKTGIDAIIDKYGKDSDDYNRYINNVNKLFNKGNGTIRKAKHNKLLMKGKDLPDGFIERDLRNSQYIAKKAKQMLEEVVQTVNTTTGKVTSRLREDWQLINVMQELNWDKYDQLGLTRYEKNKDGKNIPKIIDWTKRNDHRHHAMDALTVAFTSYEHVQYLNHMNARKNQKHEKYHAVYGIERKYMYKDDGNKLLFKSPLPLKELRFEAKKQLKNILVSFKAKNKVVTRNKNKIKIKGKNKYKIKTELTPRGQLHKETIYGKVEKYVTKEEKVGTGFDLDKINMVAKKSYREALLKRLQEFGGEPKKAFGGKNSPSKNPILVKNTNISQKHSGMNNVVPEKVKLVWKEAVYTIRKDINPDNFKNKKSIDKILDKKIKNILSERFKEYDNDAKKAFSNLDKNPIWLDKEKGISIKRVTITGVSNVESLHIRKDHNGKSILDEQGKVQPVDFVSTGNNHHVAIYRDAKGNLREKVVSFFEAVVRVNMDLPIIDKEYKKEEDWQFLFTMKQNEYFVFPSDGFNPKKIDLLNPKNASLISPHLFRVQKIATKDYFFRHHLETTVEDKRRLKGISFKRLGLSGIEEIVKVRINHLGKIVHVGEY